LDEQGRRPHDDDVDRGRLREEEHPLQLHLPRAGAHAVRGRVPGQELAGPGEGDVPDAVRGAAHRADGPARGGGGRGALPLLGRGGVHHRPGLSHRWRRAGNMKLIRVGEPGRERPGVLLGDGTRVDVSSCVPDFDEAFFGGDGLATLARWLPGNASSARSVQLERGGQWVKGKSADTFAPLGPYLATRDEVPDPQRLGMWLKVNGEYRQRSSTGNMIFAVPVLVSYLSQFMTLLPGDVISTGTPAGVGLGMKPEPVYLKPGDVVELGIEGLGESRQEIVPPI